MIVSAFRRRAGLALAAMLVALPLGAHAGDIADSAAEAESQLAAGRPADALSAFDKTVAAFWAASPLQLRVATFADSVGGFGNYTARADASFKAGDTLTVYLEPVGYGFTAEGGRFKIAIAADLEVKTPGGLVFGKADDFARLTWTSQAKLHEVHATIASLLPALKPGDYELMITLRDLGSPKTATVTLPFKVVAE